jgi:hypothetical protein
MDIESLIPLLFAAIYIISRIIKARSKKDAPGTPMAPARPVQGRQPVVQTDQTVPKKAFSFEDILKELEKSMAPEEYEEEKPLPVEEIRYEKPKKTVPVYQKPEPTVYETYEGLTYEMLEAAGEEKPEEFGRNEKYQLKEQIVNDYIQMMREPGGARKAIVLSEIINKKYF